MGIRIIYVCLNIYITNSFTYDSSECLLWIYIYTIFFFEFAKICWKLIHFTFINIRNAIFLFTWNAIKLEKWKYSWKSFYLREKFFHKHKQIYSHLNMYLIFKLMAFLELLLHLLAICSDYVYEWYQWTVGWLARRV